MSNFAVLGSPISHSKSPVIHNAIFRELGESHSYQAVELAADLKEYLSQLDESWQGLSLTMPLKEQALDAAMRVDFVAVQAQAVNTLIKTDSGWDGFNTDVFGIQQAFLGKKFSSVAVLGTGATARSAIVAMLEAGKNVSVWGRNPAKVSALASEFEISVIDKLHTALSQPAVISTVIAGALDELLKGEYKGLLLDVIYHPWPTKLALHFPEKNRVSGLEMLLWQAIGQQRLFHQHDLDEPLAGEAKLILAARKALEMAK
jgi:shikimate dehydrogenase